MDGHFKNHIVIRIAQLGPPPKMNLDRFDQGCQFSQKFIYGHGSEPVYQAMLRPL